MALAACTRLELHTSRRVLRNNMYKRTLAARTLCYYYYYCYACVLYSCEM